MLWGITPALDLLSEYRTFTNNTPLPSELNILIVGGADSRHVLKTLSRKYKHDAKIKINFYVVETCMESVARQLLLLITALQPCMGLEQKTKVFMELYGNTLIRPFTAKYLTNIANELIKFVTDYEYMHLKIPFVNLNVKYKERDYLENIFKFWCSKEEFHIVDYWDRRLRKSLGPRYDSKIGAFDWDLHMKMRLIGGKQVCDQEYKSFRLNGVAFSWLESEVSRPNRSLACGILPNGDKYAHYGYLGDMETGPFVAFGLDCEDETFLKCTNGLNSYRSTDITERNLKQIFFELEHMREYEHTKKNDMELGCAVVKRDKLVVDVTPPEITKKLFSQCIQLENVSIKFLSVSVLEQMRHKKEFKEFFNVLYFANNYIKHFSEDTVKHVSTNKNVLIIEHQLFVMSHRKKNLEEFFELVRKKTSDMDMFDFNVEKDSYMKFTINK